MGLCNPQVDSAGHVRKRYVGKVLFSRCLGLPPLSSLSVQAQRECLAVYSYLNEANNVRPAQRGEFRRNPTAVDLVEAEG